MKLLSRLLLLIIALIVIAFAVSNHAQVTMSLWPFDQVLIAPLGLICFSMLLLGMLLGGGWMWLSMLPHRFLSRRLKRENALLHEHIKDLKYNAEIKPILAPRRAATGAAYDFPSVPRPKRNWKFWSPSP